MKKLITNVVPEPLLREAQLRALKLYADVIKCTYGPMGAFTVYSKTNTDNKTMAVSYYSKDGLTNLKNVEVDQPIEALLKDELIDICANVVKTIGDGTSSAVILSHYIFKGMLELYDKGYTKRMIINAFKELVEEMIDRITANGRDVNLEDIYNIAYTSTNGNEEIANLLMSLYRDYGTDVWIDVQASSGTQTIVKSYEGMSYDNGYLDPCFINNEVNHTCEMSHPHVYVFESPIDTPEMVKLFSMIIQREVNEPLQFIHNAQQKGKPLPEGYRLNPVLIFCPFISRDANSYLDNIISSFTQTAVENRFHFCIVSNMSDDISKLIDIMKLTGAKFIKKYIDPKQYEMDQKAGLAPTYKNIVSFAGDAEKVIIDSVSTRIINPAKMRDENGDLSIFFNNYISELKDILTKKEETKEDIVEIGKLKRRINNLLGNMIDLYIGGIGTSDKKSLLDSVEDAVLNCRSAAKEGVGFGASFESLKVANEMEKHYNSFEGQTESKEIKCKIEMMRIVMRSYLTMITELYAEYFEDPKLAMLEVLGFIGTEENIARGPLNMISGEYDGTVLTSIKTDVAILESLSRILTVVFNTNQFLVPAPQFNCYTEKETVSIINQKGKTVAKEVIEEDEEELPTVEELNSIVSETFTVDSGVSVDKADIPIEVEPDVSDSSETIITTTDKEEINV